MRFHEKNYARQYDQRLSDEGYPGNIFTYICSELSESADILDIGAGTGFISVPLAEKGFRVKALDPSKEMLAILETKIAGRNLDIELLNEDWESYNGESEDIIISVHSLYPMKDPVYAISKMKGVADKSVVVVRKKIQEESVADIIRNRFGKKRCSQISDEDVKLILEKSEVSFKHTDIIQTRITRFSDISDEADYYISHYGLSSEDKKEISDIIFSKSEKSDQDYFYKTIYNDSIIVF